MDNKTKIIRILSDGRFHSGEKLAETLGMSRAAVWKHLNHLKQQYNLQIYSVRGRGYRLNRPIELLDVELIQHQIVCDASQKIVSLEVHEQIDSTNSYLMAKAMSGAESGHVCIAEQQTAGRGRRGRSWVSPFGSNIYLSVLWRYDVGIADLSGISIAAGVVVARALERLGVNGVGLKWPNDILFDGKKLAGLLLEATGEQSGPSRVVLGIGLNTSLTHQEGEAISQPWIDLSSITGKDTISRNALTAVLVSELIKMMSVFEDEGMQSVLADWKRYDIHYDQPVVLRMSETHHITGVHKGIDTTGALLMEIDGKIKTFHGGEVSLRSV